MIVNIKGSLGHTLNREQSTALGIQKWLVSKGYCKKSEEQVNSAEYKALLYEFAHSQQGFDVARIKTLESLENYVQSRFHKFCCYCGDKYRKI